MKLNGKVFMSLGLMVITAYVVVTATKWPFKTALFPLVAAIPVFCMATAVFFLELFGKEKAASGAAVDFQLAQQEDQVQADKRTIHIFLWILGWFCLILLVGFSLSIPIYFIAFLRFRSKESWKMTIILSIIAWAFFYGLFVRLLDTPFMPSLMQRGLEYIGILS